MSHVARYETSIGKTGCVDETLLKHSLNLAAKELGGEVGATMDSRQLGKNQNSFQGQTLFGSIRTKAMPEGMGVIRTKDGKLQFVHDLDGNRAGFEKAKTALERQYKTLALAVAMKKLNYNVTVNTSESGKVVVTGTSESV